MSNHMITESIIEQAALDWFRKYSEPFNWMRETASGLTKFITLYPDKGGGL